MEYASNGSIEMIVGCMFSGKTEELMRRLRRSIIAGRTVGIFKPVMDDRYDKEEVVSHDNRTISSVAVSSIDELKRRANDFEVIGIDEVQFFHEPIVEMVVEMANSGKRLIISGLDLDYNGKPFGPVPDLMAVAEYVTKIHAICMRCGEPAAFSFRLSKSDDQILVGHKSDYEARCRKCFYDGVNS